MLSGITAGGIEALVPWPAARTVTIAADRDEAKHGLGFKRGEKAARRLALVRAQLEEQPQLIPQLALPGAPGTKCDFLNLLLDKGVAELRATVLGAEPIVPTAKEIDDHWVLEAITAAYPPPYSTAGQFSCRTVKIYQRGLR